MSLHKEIALQGGLCAHLATLISAADAGKIDLRGLILCAQAKAA